MKSHHCHSGGSPENNLLKTILQKHEEVFLFYELIKASVCESGVGVA